MLEVREKEELNALNIYIDAVGVNNRNLNNFEVNVSQSFELADLISSDFRKISESGINDVKIIQDLKNIGYKGFLIGELFMKNSKPEIACAKFIKDLIALNNTPTKKK